MNGVYGVKGVMARRSYGVLVWFGEMGYWCGSEDWNNGVIRRTGAMVLKNVRRVRGHGPSPWRRACRRLCKGLVDVTRHVERAVSRHQRSC